MSWACLPWWVYAVINEEHEARMLCAFEEELQAGYVRSLPKHVVAFLQRERKEYNDELP